MYQPINCNFYDILEAAATTKKVVKIIYTTSTGEAILNAKIVDLYTKNKEEFMVLDNQLTIRLDKIVSVDDEKLAGFCSTSF